MTALGTLGYPSPSSPYSTTAGTNISITSNITNIGDATGTFGIRLLNSSGSVVAIGTEVTIAPGFSQSSVVTLYNGVTTSTDFTLVLWDYTNLAQAASLPYSVVIISNPPFGQIGSITPTSVISGQTATLSVPVTNTGGSSGNFTVGISSPGGNLTSSQFTLAANASTTIQFSGITFTSTYSGTASVADLTTSKLDSAGSYTMTVLPAPSQGYIFPVYPTTAPANQATTLYVPIENVGGTADTFIVDIDTPLATYQSAGQSLSPNQSVTVSFSGLYFSSNYTGKAYVSKSTSLSADAVENYTITVTPPTGNYSLFKLSNITPPSGSTFLTTANIPLQFTVTNTGTASDSVFVSITGPNNYSSSITLTLAASASSTQNLNLPGVTGTETYTISLLNSTSAAIDDKATLTYTGPTVTTSAVTSSPTSANPSSAIPIIAAGVLLLGGALLMTGGGGRNAMARN